MANHATPEPKRMDVLQHIRTLLNQRLRSEMEELAGPKPSSHYEDMNTYGHEYIAPTVCYGMSGNFKNSGRWFTICARPEHLKTGVPCQYPRFLSPRLSSVVMDKLQELLVLYCMTGTKWGTTPYPELDVFTKYLQTHAVSNPDPTAATQQPTPPSAYVSNKVNGKRRARSPTPETPVRRKKSKYDYMRIKPSNLTSHSAPGASTSRAHSGSIIAVYPEVIEISDSD